MPKKSIWFRREETILRMLSEHRFRFAFYYESLCLKLQFLPRPSSCIGHESLLCLLPLRESSHQSLHLQKKLMELHDSLSSPHLEQLFSPPQTIQKYNINTSLHCFNICLTSSSDTNYIRVHSHALSRLTAVEIMRSRLAIWFRNCTVPYVYDSAL